MQNLPYYIFKEFIAVIKGQEIIQRYPSVDVFIGQIKIVGMSLEVSTHRLVWKSNSNNCLLLRGQNINHVAISQAGFFSKEYFVDISSTFGLLKLQLKGHNQAKITIESMSKKKAWLHINEQKKPQGSQMYTGMFSKINQEKKNIQIHNQQLSGSFQSFETLFGNLRQIKAIMNNMKDISGQSDGDNPQVNKILKDMGFVAVVQKNQVGTDFYRQLAKDLFQICQLSLFKNYGGMVALLDLFYFYNKKRQLNLLAPQEILKACQLFPALGLQARIAKYPNNIILIESTSLDAAKDFQENFEKYFTNYTEGHSAEQLSRRKGLPVAIVDIKLRNACKIGKLAVSDRIQGIKYYKNLLLSI